MKRCRVEISGLVQGVGFRPFIYRTAETYNVTGFVRNTLQGVTIEAEANQTNLDRFLESIRKHPPTAARVESVMLFDIATKNDSGFQIEQSDNSGASKAVMPKDRSPCSPCITELFDPKNRRYLYPFITCNECGPRFTIAEALPFDRTHTTMKLFQLCEECRVEYHDPSNRRFHAQTISCRNCGPQLALCKKAKLTQHQHACAIAEAASIVKQGGLIAVKGVGGYQLVCSALASTSIARIRRYKERRLKPFAVMAPSIADAAMLCHISPSESELLSSPVAPVVLLYITDTFQVHRTICPAVAPGLLTMCVMLPSSPLHHLLLSATQEWLVVTSANRGGEPMFTQDSEAMANLSEVVDGILSHDRIIAHLADDSVVRDAGGQTIVMRHARGLAPTEIRTSQGNSFYGAIGFGGHTMSAFALATADRLVLCQHIGDLGSQRARDVFLQELKSLEKIYAMDRHPNIICRDAHPTYNSTALAEERSKSTRSVYHHEAHLASLIAERHVVERSLGVVCDGTGLGRNNTIWGGEFFLIEKNTCKRIGSLLPFRLPGGERAINEPRRSALGMLYETYGDKAASTPFALREFTDTERTLLISALKQDINAPYTTSLGRLFDGLSALLGLCSISDYEAQAPMALEVLAKQTQPQSSRPIVWTQDTSGFWQWDWRNLVSAACEAYASAEKRHIFSTAFHATIVQAVYELAQQFEVTKVLLTGGVFQNAVLVKNFQTCFDAAGISLVTHQVVPPGDGGLALGQVAAVHKKARPTCA